VRLTVDGDARRAQAEQALGECDRHFLEPLSAVQRAALLEALAVLTAQPPAP